MDALAGPPGLESAGTLAYLAVPIIVLINIGQALILFRVARSRSAKAVPLELGAERLFFVFVLPCLNEALVIAASVRRLLELPSENFAVLVVDDGSDDSTSGEAAALADPRVHILRRELPEARQGKGRALNAAVRYLRTSGMTAAYEPADVVLGVLDADGRLQPNALAEIEPYFVADPRLAAVQIGVRMHNAHEGLLARMQDLEFVVYTELFERGRHAFGAAGLGGNGQFVRLSALLSLPGQPWTDCLTEDLDLGINLITTGWRTGFCPRTHVSQQAVVSLRRLLRQRSRWFQGHLQCWRRVPALIATPSLRLRSAVDAIYSLTSPVLVLLVSLMTLGFAVGLVEMSFTGSAHRLLSAYGAFTLLIAYLLSAALAPMVAFVYWLRDRNTSAVAAVLLAHVYLGYVYLWVPAGWWALCRVLRRRRGWAKTERTLDADIRMSGRHCASEPALEATSS